MDRLNRERPAPQSAPPSGSQANSRQPEGVGEPTQIKRAGFPSKRVGAQPPRPVLDQPLRTFVVDIGGTGIKALIVNEIGEPMTERLRVPTPRTKKPADVIKTIKDLAKQAGEFQRISVGFPGVVRAGVVTNAVNLAPEWDHFHLTNALTSTFEKPARAANDADVQGFGAISGTGVELVITLGTGVGSSLFVDGRLVPNVEVGKNRLRNSELQRVGKKRWNRRLGKVIAKLERMFHYDRLYIGGGNAAMVDVHALPGNVTIVSNLNGLLGGIALWQDPRATDRRKKIPKSAK